MKHHDVAGTIISNAVAPHTGAWIETVKLCNAEGDEVVAPHTGAWIETFVINTNYGAACGRSSYRSVD